MFTHVVRSYFSLFVRPSVRPFQNRAKQNNFQMTDCGSGRVNIGLFWSYVLFGIYLQANFFEFPLQNKLAPLNYRKMIEELEVMKGVDISKNLNKEEDDEKCHMDQIQGNDIDFIPGRLTVEEGDEDQFMEKTAIQSSEEI